LSLKFRKIKLIEFIKTWIGIVLGFVFLYLASIDIDLDKFTTSFTILNWFPLLIIIIIRILALVLRGFRWQAVLEHEKKISPFRLFRIASIGEMGNYLLPARFGELMRVFIVSKKENISKSTALGSVFADRFLDFFTVVIVFLILMSFIPLPDDIRQIGWIALVLLVITIIGFVILYNLPKNLFQFKLFSHPDLSEKINQIINRFRHSLKGLKNPQTLLRAVLISLIIWFINIVSFHLVIISLNLELAWYYSGMTIVIIALGMIIPSAPGYVGTYEFFCVFSLSYFSIEKSAALVCALISHGLLYVVILAVGIVCYMVEIVPVNRLKILREIKKQNMPAENFYSKK
jgi:uncharacterized protein (TIRG00374 family)